MKVINGIHYQSIKFINRILDIINIPQEILRFISRPFLINLNEYDKNEEVTFATLLQSLLKILRNFAWGLGDE